MYRYKSREATVRPVVALCDHMTTHWSPAAGVRRRPQGRTAGWPQGDRADPMTGSVKVRALQRDDGRRGGRIDHCDPPREIPQPDPPGLEHRAGAAAEHQLRLQKWRCRATNGQELTAVGGQQEGGQRVLPRLGRYPGRVFARMEPAGLVLSHARGELI